MTPTASRIWASTLCGLVIGLPGAAGAAPPDWSFPASWQGRIIGHHPRPFKQRLLALTFDDGPSRNVTPMVLDTLKRHGAHATFFVLGPNVSANPGLVRRAVAEGHCIGSHGWSHSSRIGPVAAATEIRRTAEAVRKACGVTPTCFRPPYGITRNGYVFAAAAQRYSIWLWSISSADTARIDAATIARNVIHTPSPGDFVLMHDASGHVPTAQALDQILAELGRAGYRFVTLPEMLRAWGERTTSAPPGPASRRPRPPSRS